MVDPDKLMHKIEFAIPKDLKIFNHRIREEVGISRKIDLSTKRLDEKMIYEKNDLKVKRVSKIELFIQICHNNPN